MSGARISRLLMAATIAGALAGCAPPIVLMHPQATAHDTTRVAAPGRPISTPTAAAIDSGPSPEALAVLAGIPDPIPAGERVPPPAMAPPAATEGAGADSTVQDTGGSTRGADIPVPQPTPVLGEHPNTALVDNSAGAAAAGGAAKGAATGGAATAGATAGGAQAPVTAPRTCWRLQVGAPDDKDEAKAKRAAAESQLLVPMVIEDEKGLHKIRTRDCYDRATADRLRDRARAAGFDGAFPFERATP